MCIRRIHKVDGLTLLPAGDGRAFEWNFSTGITPIDKLSGFRVSAVESGFRYHLALAQAPQ